MLKCGLLYYIGRKKIGLNIALGEIIAAGLTAYKALVLRLFIG